MSRATVAVFGGSFNPPHVAHVLVAAYALSVCGIDRFLVVPTFIHPFAKPLAPFDDRHEMCRIAFGWIPGVEISRVEQELGGQSRTLRTLRHLAEQHPDWSLRLVIGADVIADAPRWFGFEEIRQLAPLIVLGRVGVNEPTAQAAGVFPDISSTQVRQAIQEGRLQDVRALMPWRVVDYIVSRGLYVAAGP
ncbi:MAG: nicotinate (nicotinamide) nucleotide adenylyltransferase [Deltaproteobacteria bacterium]|nr:nicotinate (nicotinamide) nucleotide adenylyltransferase [Deltaproteobacteria bacterium]